MEVYRWYASTHGGLHIIRINSWRSTDDMHRLMEVYRWYASTHGGLHIKCINSWRCIDDMHRLMAVYRWFISIHGGLQMIYINSWRFVEICLNLGTLQMICIKSWTSIDDLPKVIEVYGWCRCTHGGLQTKRVHSRRFADNMLQMRRLNWWRSTNDSHLLMEVYRRNHEVPQMERKVGKHLTLQNLFTGIQMVSR